MGLLDSVNVNVGGNGRIIDTLSTYVTKVLKPNVVDGKNVLTQDMMSAANTKYVIKYDFTLGEDITVPANCVLEFDGGSINGKNIISNDTIILGNYKDSISHISGSFITEDYVKSIGLSEELSNFIVVKDGNELSSALSAVSPNYNTIFLMGDVFIISSTVTVNFTGNVVPYPGYKPQVISGVDTVYKYEQDSENEDYLTCNMPSMNSGRHFYLFDGNGNNIEVQKLSDLIGTVPIADGDVVKDGSIIKIKMTSSISSVLANKSQNELKYCVLMLNAGFTTVQIDKLYTDSQYIYGEIWQWEYWSSYYNYEKSTYGVNAPYEIYNVPVYGGGKSFIDGNKNLHLCKSKAGNTILSLSEVVFNLGSSSSALTFNGITFKGGGANTFFGGGTASNKSFINCTFEYILNCYITSSNPTSENIVFDNCNFKNIGCNALVLRGRNNKVKNCHFNKIGELVKRANCIEFLGYNTLIENNYFSDFSYAAIYTGNASYNTCVIRYNIIEQVEYKENPQKYVLRDGAGIYVHMQNENVLIVNNIVRHIVEAPSSTLTFDNRGIFLDNGACNVTVESNIVFDIYSFAIDSRYVSSIEYSCKNNIFSRNILFGSCRFEGNPSATESEKAKVNHNFIANEFNIVTNEYIKDNINYFVGMSVVNDIVHCSYHFYDSWVSAHIKENSDKAFTVEKNKVDFIIAVSAVINKNIYCPTTPNKIINDNSYGIYYATYKIYFSTDYLAYPGKCYTLNVIFDTKNGRAALMDIIGLKNTNTGRARITKITTQSISNAYSSNKGFLLNITFVGDTVKPTFCTVVLESVESQQSYLPCSTYLSIENAAQEESVEIINIPSSKSSIRPTFTPYLENSYIGYQFFDTSPGLNKPIYYAGKDGNNQDVWVDATGTPV